MYLVRQQTWSVYCKMATHPNAPRTRVVVHTLPFATPTATLAGAALSDGAAADQAAAWRAAPHRALSAVRCMAPASVDRRCVTTSSWLGVRREEEGGIDRESGVCCWVCELE